MGFGETFKALSDPVRREILMLLKGGRLSAGEIGAHFQLTGATMSYHLNMLKKAELVAEEREKKLYLLPAAGKRTGGNHAVDVGFNGGGKNA